MSEKQTEVPLSKADVEGMLKTFVAQMKEQFGLQFAEVDKNFTAKMNEIQIAMKASRKPDVLPAGEGKIETPKYVNSEGMVFPMETNYLPEFLKANAANQKAHIPERSA